MTELDQTPQPELETLEVRQSPLHVRVAESLRLHFIEGTFKVDEKLPSERRLAEILNVSRTVLRDALALLELEGFVEIRPRSGVILKRREGPNTFSGSTEPGTLEIIEARLVIEREIAAAACKMITAEEIKSLEDRLQIMAESDIMSDARRSADREFHLIIARAAHNSLLQRFLEETMETQYRSQIWQQFRRHWPQTRDTERLVATHREIVDALRSGNSNRARGAAEAHMLELFGDIQAVIGRERHAAYARGFWIDGLR